MPHMMLISLSVEIAVARLPEQALRLLLLYRALSKKLSLIGRRMRFE